MGGAAVQRLTSAYSSTRRDTWQCRDLPTMVAVEEEAAVAAAAPVVTGGSWSGLLYPLLGVCLFLVTGYLAVAYKKWQEGQCAAKALAEAEELQKNPRTFTPEECVLLLWRAVLCVHAWLLNLIRQLFHGAGCEPTMGTTSRGRCCWRSRGAC